MVYFDHDVKESMQFATQELFELFITKLKFNSTSISLDSNCIEKALW